MIPWPESLRSEPGPCPKAPQNDRPVSNQSQSGFFLPVHVSAIKIVQFSM